MAVVAALVYCSEVVQSVSNYKNFCQSKFGQPVPEHHVTWYVTVILGHRLCWPKFWQSVYPPMCCLAKA